MPNLRIKATNDIEPILRRRHLLGQWGLTILSLTAISWSLSPQPALAMGGGGGATEVTQLLNNVQLADQNIKQATMVIQQIQTAISTATTVIHGITNLRNLPQDLLSSTLAPYQSQVADLQQLLGVVNNLKTSFSQDSDMIVWRANDAQASGLPFGDYIKRQINLAATQGGSYRARIQSDIATINNLGTRAAQLRTLSSQNQAVTGNVQGLQLLNQQASLQAGELMEIKAALLAANIDREQGLAVQADDTIVKGNTVDKTVKGAKSRAGRDQGLTYQAPTPWKQTWPGMGSAP